MINSPPSPLLVISQKYEMVESTIYTLIGISPLLHAKTNALSINSPSVHLVKALWDTGAQMTCISERLAKKMNLEVRRFDIIGTAAGIVTDTPVYLAHLFFSNQTQFLNWELVEFASLGDDDADLIIGMDIIMQGDFALTNLGGRSLFSFRLPSMQSIDFEADHLLAK